MISYDFIFLQMIEAHKAKTTETNNSHGKTEPAVVVREQIQC